nr:hypothetical protein [uncultured Draconibacterium sp.]
MKNLNYLLILVNIVFFSCKDNDHNFDTEINIGENNKNVTVNTLNPSISVTDQQSDSIDLNGDSIYDLIFEKTPIPLTTGFGLETKITKKDGIQIVLSTINNYSDSLSYLDKLNHERNWSGNIEETLILQSYLNRNESRIIGNFVFNEIKYLGIKIENRYGWVKVENDRFGSLIIDEYALMK